MAKGAGDENFPVASKLLPAWSRPHVKAFYAFARAADDVADDPDLTPAAKLQVLDAMNTQIDAGAAHPYAEVDELMQSLEESGVTSQHAKELLSAFMRDVEQPRTQDWVGLMAYCRFSAAPVGRYLIDLLGGVEGDDPAASDALCSALQILNHLQDVRSDLERLDRVYVPANWMMVHGVNVEDLRADRCTPALRAVFDLMLDGVEGLLVAAKPLPRQIRSKALAREAGGVLAVAWRLARALRRQDPLAERVELPRTVMGAWFLWGALTA